MAGESEAALERACVFDELIDGANLARAGFGIGVTEEAIGSERHAIAQAAAEKVADRHAPGLAKNIEARELQCGEYLSAIVVQRSGRVGDEETHLLQPRRIVAHQVG